MEMDPYVLAHLDAWLEREVKDPGLAARYRAAMLALVAEDPDYWTRCSWWVVYDHVREQIEEAA